jgi:hypothetical protein
VDARPLKKTPQIIERIRALMQYETAGDPIRGMKWTRKATQKIAAELHKEDIMVSDKTVARLLKELGFSLQANRKRIALDGNGSKEKRQERDMQFRHICRMRDSFARRKEPVISVDTKKKELIGNFKNAGRVWRDTHRDVADHDFPSYARAKIAPYGIYDTTANCGSVYLGVSHDTAAFAADSIRSWWEMHGKPDYPHARRILILADCGGSNNPTSTAWKYHLWENLCQHHGLKVTVCHYPSGASKWNPIEHRLFSEISKNWAGEPLTSLQTALHYIRSTKTDTGLQVTAHLNRKKYELKEKIQEDRVSTMSIHKNKFLPKLNYLLLPKKC